MKIRTYPVTEVAGLADVDNFPAGILHQIDTRVGGQLFQLFVYQVTCHRCLRALNRPRLVLVDVFLQISQEIGIGFGLFQSFQNPFRRFHEVG